jgi:hypothetical protein
MDETRATDEGKTAMRHIMALLAPVAVLGLTTIANAHDATTTVVRLKHDTCISRRELGRQGG